LFWKMNIRSVLLGLLLLAAAVHCSEGQDFETIGSAKYTPPRPSKPVVFFEPFDETWNSRWVQIKNGKYTGEFKVTEPTAFAGIPGDKGLVIPEKARHYAAVAKFPSVLDTKDKDLVVQYEVRFQNGIECGGAYIKLLTNTPGFSAEAFADNTPYTIMFGPDKCGSTNKVHFIFRHQNPVTKEWEEKHLQDAPGIKADRITHLYTLHVRPDNTFDIFVDQEKVKSGSLLEDFSPPVNPPAQIDDPTDSKPADWVDEAEIPDPDARKPADWNEDEPEYILDDEAVKPAGWLDNEPEEVADPEAEKPEDWDDALDGEWLAPTIPNPKCDEVGCGKWTAPKIRNPAYKGKWRAALIPNPKYKGPWAPRQIPNPAFFEDKHPHHFAPMAALGIEVWQMSDGILFDNFIIGHDKRVADEYAAKTWAPRFAAEEKHQSEEDAKHKPASDTAPLMEQVQAVLQEVAEYLRENPLVGVASAIALLIPIGIAILWSPRPAHRAAAPQAKAAAKEPKEPKEPKQTKIEEPITPAKEEKSEGEDKSPGAQKRKPKKKATT
jgi:calnexin